MSVKYLNDTGTGRLVDHLRLKGLTGVLSQEGWEPISDSGSSPSWYYQIAEIEGIDPNDYIVVQADQTKMSLSNIEEMEKDKVRYIDHDEDGLIFIAKKAPSFDIPLNIVKQGGI